MKKITILIIVFTCASVISGCANTQNTTASGTPNSSATVSTTTSGISSVTTTTTTASITITSSITSSPGTTTATSRSTSTVGTTSIQPVTLDYVAKKWFCSVGQLNKVYYYYARTGADQKKVDYSMKILSIKTVNDKDIKMEIEIGKSGISSVLHYDFLDEYGREFGERPSVSMGTGTNGSSIRFFTETNANLANHTKFIVMSGLDAEKNNGETKVIFEIVK